MPSPVVRPREVVIAEEQEYLFHSRTEDLQTPQWSDAACRDASPDVFFPLSPHDLTSRREALSWCAVCPIVDPCREVALRDPSIVGIWGGTDELERSRLRGRRLPRSA
ncbi:MAG: hypothetical protein GC157_07785 [Frankiales bacterium]|nr:hypothetical protein [Frankiales bacterium]